MWVQFQNSPKMIASRLRALNTPVKETRPIPGKSVGAGILYIRKTAVIHKTSRNLHWVKRRITVGTLILTVVPGVTTRKGAGNFVMFGNALVRRVCLQCNNYKESFVVKLYFVICFYVWTIVKYNYQIQLPLTNIFTVTRVISRQPPICFHATDTSTFFSSVSMLPAFLQRSHLLQCCRHFYSLLNCFHVTDISSVFPFVSVLQTPKCLVEFWNVTLNVL